MGRKLESYLYWIVCDREIISYFVSSGGFTAEMAQYAMLCAVEKRFNNCKTSHKVELLLQTMDLAS